MQFLNSTIFRIIPVSLGVEFVNLLLFFTQFECVYILMSTLAHSGIVQVKRSPPPPPPPHKSKGTPMCFDFFLSTMEKKCLQPEWQVRRIALHVFFFFPLRWLTTHVQLFARMIVITSQNLLDCAWICCFQLEGRKISSSQFLKVLSTLRVWEICAPDINAAIEVIFGLGRVAKQKKLA